jgi:F-type H+-transporting ATPase subunit b
LRRLLITLTLCVCAAVAQHSAPAAGHGAHAEAAVEHGEGHEDARMPNEIWWKWANFAILAAGLGFLIAKYAGPFFSARTEEIQRGITEASAVRADAEARAAEIEKQIANLSAEVEALKQKSREEIAREGERVSAETAQQIAKVQRQAEAEIAAAVKNASQELKAYSAQLAVDLAAQQIRSSLKPADHDKLAEAFADDIRKKAALN